MGGRRDGRKERREEGQMGGRRGGRKERTVYNVHYKTAGRSDSVPVAGVFRFPGCTSKGGLFLSGRRCSSEELSTAVAASLFPPLATETAGSCSAAPVPYTLFCPFLVSHFHPATPTSASMARTGAPIKRMRLILLGSCRKDSLFHCATSITASLHRLHHVFTHAHNLSVIQCVNQNCSTITHRDTHTQNLYRQYDSTLPSVHSWLLL